MICCPSISFLPCSLSLSLSLSHTHLSLPLRRDGKPTEQERTKTCSLPISKKKKSRLGRESRLNRGGAKKKPPVASSHHHLRPSSLPPYPPLPNAESARVSQRGNRTTTLFRKKHGIGFHLDSLPDLIIVAFFEVVGLLPSYHRRHRYYYYLFQVSDLSIWDGKAKERERERERQSFRVRSSLT
jgi:hypothetical protein